ncbi:hypothetical protein GPX89_02355 [Nocardia sp. ET3-3]|uniref:Uncharacterized protein n=1 Tax=Nocardia terrae TaxID=2675851 RepID=A0A7K1UP23_9NOCA|nr:hypothetical protein [Nocardia terrae]MVU76084.1 hypothetical protein [Nocardia terrae]
MGTDTGDPRQRADLDEADREAEFADEHQAVTAEHDPDDETESPEGLGGMDFDDGGAV